jgi:hypothetical protein
MASRNAGDSFDADEMALKGKAKMLISWSHANSGKPAQFGSKTGILSI